MFSYILMTTQGLKSNTILGQLSLASLRGRLIEYRLQLGKGGSVTSAGWQVTLCDPMWHVSSRNGLTTLRTAIHLLLTYLRCDTIQDAILTCARKPT